MQIRLITLVVVMLVAAGSAAAATTPPRNTVLPTISGTARQGEILTADQGTWSGTQPMTFSYQWRRCDTSGGSCSNIVGATSKTYTLTSVDVGNRLRVRVRASNSAGSSTAISPATAAVGGPQPPKSLSLRAGQSTVVYGRAVSLFGSLANGQQGESVTITERRVPSFSGVSAGTVATIQAATDGSFNILVRPVSRTLYRASNGQTTSNTIAVNVRPRLVLTRLASHRFALKALAAHSFAGRYGVLQRLRKNHWINVRRVVFTRAFVTDSPTITSRAVFRARLGKARIRVLVPSGQVSPGYVRGVSNIASA
ncbi:MAG TPA: hypothetical protein VNR59_02475 [Gaiellaceae bacterium]|nr:hypothetical protein [Gaiellaceae bacterium]HWJ44221.1 hypothetical protein [Gaiellaceae bacterium]